MPLSLLISGEFQFYTQIAKSIAGNQPVFTPDYKSLKMDVHPVQGSSLLSNQLYEHPNIPS